MYLYEFQDKIFLYRKVTFSLSIVSTSYYHCDFNLKVHAFISINQTFEPSISRNKKQKLYIRFKLFHTMYIYTPDLSCLVSSGLFLSGGCVANDNTDKHKVMVQISKHFAIVVLSIKNK